MRRRASFFSTHDVCIDAPVTFDINVVYVRCILKRIVYNYQDFVLKTIWIINYDDLNNPLLMQICSTQVTIFMASHTSDHNIHWMQVITIYLRESNFDRNYNNEINMMLILEKEKGLDWDKDVF